MVPIQPARSVTARRGEERYGRYKISNSWSPSSYVHLHSCDSQLQIGVPISQNYVTERPQFSLDIAPHSVSVAGRVVRVHRNLYTNPDSVVRLAECHRRHQDSNDKREWPHRVVRYNSLRLSRPGQRPQRLNEAKVAPTLGRAEDAGALGRPAAAGYTALSTALSILVQSPRRRRLYPIVIRTEDQAMPYSEIDHKVLALAHAV